jgi:hypothetical protein
VTLFIPKVDNAKTNAIFQDIFQSFIYPKVPPEQRGDLETHLAWMMAQPETYINTKVESHPAFEMTRITLEISHKPIPPISLLKQ